MPFIVMHRCDACTISFHRVFTDSWTGKDLCPDCLSSIIADVDAYVDDYDEDLVQMVRVAEVS